MRIYNTAGTDTAIIGIGTDPRQQKDAIWKNIDCSQT